MDETTQQNSALVEENAAAAKALEHQSQAMDERVSFFRVDEAQSDDGAPQAHVAMAQAPARRHSANGARRPAAA